MLHISHWDSHTHIYCLVEGEGGREGGWIEGGREGGGREGGRGKGGRESGKEGGRRRTI